MLTVVPSIEPRLITTKALTYLDFKVRGESIVQGVFGWDTWSSKLTQNNQFFQSNWFDFSPPGQPATSGNQFVLGNLTISGSTMSFIRIGHSLFAMLAGWLGGQLSRRLCRTSRSSEPSMAVNVEGTNS